VIINFRTINDDLGELLAFAHSDPAKLGVEILPSHCVPCDAGAVCFFLTMPNSVQWPIEVQGCGRRFAQKPGMPGACCMCDVCHAARNAQ
jgi:hypothetical protein